VRKALEGASSRGSATKVPQMTMAFPLGSTTANSQRAQAAHLSSSSSSPAPGAQSLDVLALAEKRVMVLEQEVEAARAECRGLEELVGRLHKAVAGRDEEIARLGRLLEGGRPAEALQKDAREFDLSQANKRLESQVEYLTAQIAALEKDVAAGKKGRADLEAATLEKRRLADKLRAVEQQNHGLVSELKEIRRLTSKLKVPQGHDMVSSGGGNGGGGNANEKAEEVKKLLAENQALRKEKDRFGEVVLAYQTDKAQFTAQAEALRAERDRTVASLARMSEELSGARTELAVLRARVEDADRDADALIEDQNLYAGTLTELQRRNADLEAMLDDVERRSDALAKLNDLAKAEHAATEARLKEERERTGKLERELAQLRGDKEGFRGEAEILARANRHTQITVASLEEERDFVRQENDRLAGLLREAQASASSASREVAALEESGRAAARRAEALSQDNSRLTEQLAAKAAEAVRLAQQLDRVKRDRSALEGTVPRAEQLIAQLGEARADVVARDAEITRSAKRAQELTLSLAVATEERDSARGLLADTQRERDFLAATVQSFEQQLGSIQDSVRALTADRDHVRSLYAQAREQLGERLRGEHEAVAQGDRLQDAVRRANAEADELRRSLQAASDQASSAQAEARRALERCAQLELAEQQAYPERLRLQDAVRKLELERDSLTERCSREHQNARAQGERAGQLDQEASALRQACEHRDEQIRQLKHLLSQLDGSQGRLADEMRSLLAAKEQDAAQLAALRSDLARAQARAKAAEDQAAQGREVLASLDHERDSLQAELDAQTERLEALAAERDQARAEAERARGDQAGLRGDLAAEAEHAGRLEHEVSRQRSAAEAQARRCSELEAEIAQRAREAKEQAEDLRSMTKENQLVNADLHRAVAESAKAQARLQEAQARVAFLEAAQGASASESAEVLRNYRALADKNQKLEVTVRRNEQVLQEAKLQIQSRETDVAAMKDYIREVEAENSRYVVDLQAYERQVEELSRSLFEREEQLHSATSRIQSLAVDADNSQMISMNLEHLNAEAQREHLAAQAERASLARRLREESARADQLSSELAHAVASRREMEGMVAALRAHEASAIVRSQGALGEVQDLQRRIAGLEEQNDALLGQVSTLHKQLELAKDDLRRARKFQPTVGAAAAAADSHDELQAMRQKLADMAADLELATNQKKRADARCAELVAAEARALREAEQARRELSGQRQRLTTEE
jgi:chromosome segregation ATPase